MNKTTIAFGTTMTPRKPRAFTPRPFPTAKSGQYTARRRTIPAARKAPADRRVHGVRHAVPRAERWRHLQAQRSILLYDFHRTQEETDRYWNAIVGNGGAESACGWCKDKWSISWQITPRVLTDAMAKGGDVAKRAFAAMMPMKKIDVAVIEAAVRG